MLQKLFFNAKEKLTLPAISESYTYLLLVRHFEYENHSFDLNFLRAIILFVFFQLNVSNGTSNHISN